MDAGFPTPELCACVPLVYHGAQALCNTTVALYMWSTRQLSDWPDATAQNPRNQHLFTNVVVNSRASRIFRYLGTMRSFIAKFLSVLATPYA